MQSLLKYSLFIFGLYATISSCKKDELNTNTNSQITINRDTLWFDTVFTNINSTAPKSVNKQILVYNPYDQRIKTSIRLGGGSNSHFRLNVDGEAGSSFSDIELYPNDSIFLFVEVHPDPNNNSPDFNPLIIRDSILFNTNGNESKTMLIGWGQDAHYIFRDSIETDTTWSNNKLPIVVYGYCYVKPGVNLTIEEGMNIHFAPRSWLFVEGKIDIKGKVDNPVLMQGDRLQPSWEEESGQWGGIWISHPSYDNTIEHAIIKNGTVGVYCDSVPGEENKRNVTINKTMIRNMSFDGISGKGSTIHVQNSVSTNCGRFTFLAANGGNYTLLHNTFYTGRRDFSRREPTFAYLNRRRDEFGSILETYDIQFYFVNNIIDGVLSETEIGEDIDYSRVITPSVVDYNLIKTNKAIYTGSGSSNIINASAKFKDSYNFNFDLDTLSAAKDMAFPLNPSIDEDFLNRARIGNADLGAYESQF
ncbi:MAG: Uncharacterised protein [Bacteroidia bacterium]|nr:MAG: Uncharacterised protein [Bacteroidia bacterium]